MQPIPFECFLDLAPEEDVIHPSLLTKFRKLRLKDMNLLDMLIQKTVTIAMEKEIIKTRSIIVDAPHTKARYNQKSPRELLQDCSKKLRRAIDQIDETIKEEFPSSGLVGMKMQGALAIFAVNPKRIIKLMDEK